MFLYILSYVSSNVHYVLCMWLWCITNLMFPLVNCVVVVVSDECSLHSAVIYFNNAWCLHTFDVKFSWNSCAVFKFPSHKFNAPVLESCILHSLKLVILESYIFLYCLHRIVVYTTQIIFTQMWCVWITNIVFIQIIIQSSLLTTVIFLNHTCSLCFDAFVDKFPSHNFQSLSSFSTIFKNNNAFF